MPGNSFGTLFRTTTFGESHGVAIGCIVDGCPAGIEISAEEIQRDLDRRRPGQSSIVTQRKESDTVQVLSGIFEGRSLGTPIALLIPNENQRSKDYSHIKDKYRPSHADFVWQEKFGHRDYRGGGRSSARETAARVAAGAIAKKLLAQNGIAIHAYVQQVGDLILTTDYSKLDFLEVEKNDVRCPDPILAAEMIDFIKKIRKEGDTVGGVVQAVVQGCPVGLGAPVFDKIHADLAKANMSINAAKGFEIGSGFGGVAMRGSQHNDIFEKNEMGEIQTQTNRSGGVQGGITNGMDIYFRVAFKPVATIMRDQASVNEAGEAIIISGKGRHDPCVVPRAVPIVEAMTALVLADHLLRARALESSSVD